MEAHLHRVATDAVHTEFGAEELAVDAEGVAGERARAEGEGGDAAGGRRKVRCGERGSCGGYAREEVAETIEVTGEGVGVGEEEVGEADGLSALKDQGGSAGRSSPDSKQVTHLEMRESSSEVVNPLLGANDENANDSLEPLNVLLDLLHEPQAHVRRDLIVPAPSSVELATDLGANDLGETALVGGVDVLVVGLNDERSRLPLALDSVETGADGGELGGGEDGRGGLREGEGVGLGTGDVDSIEALVVREALVELPHPAKGFSESHRRANKDELTGDPSCPRTVLPKASWPSART